MAAAPGRRDTSSAPRHARNPRIVRITHYVIVSASKDNRVCAVWVDDRRGALDVWARCSTDAGRSWGAETLLSDFVTTALCTKSANGFKAFYGHYGGAAIDAAGRLHAAWGAGEPAYRTGGVWVNCVEALDPNGGNRAPRWVARLSTVDVTYLSVHIPVHDRYQRLIMTGIRQHA